MLRAGCSPISRSRSLTARTRSAGSRPWWTGRICTGRWRRCRRRGGCWTPDRRRPSRRGPGGAGGGPCCRRGRPVPGLTCRRSCGWTSMPRSRSRTVRKTMLRRPGNARSGFHPLLCFLDRPDVAGGEALAGLLRPGNAGSNTAADHLVVLDQALAALPEQARPRPEIRRGRGCWRGRTPPVPPMRSRLDGDPRRGVLLRIPCRLAHPDRCRRHPGGVLDPAIQTDDDLREGAWVAEATGLVDCCPAGRKGRG